MSEPIEGLYFNWLCTRVNYNEPGRNTDILRLLHSTEFIWIIPGDENRSEDGKDLREDFFRDTRLSDDPNWDPLGCSVLEMMIAFAKRVEFQIDIPVKDAFWLMMRNLKLDEYYRVNAADIPRIEAALYSLNWRTYSYDGTGGLWPIQYPKEDQRQVEIWYQFCEYVIDRGLL